MAVLCLLSATSHFVYYASYMDMGAKPSKPFPGVVVTLDALSTLYTFREPVITQYIKVARRCGLKAPISEEDLGKAFRKSFKSLSTELPNYGKGLLRSPRAWWKTLVNDAFRQVVDEPEIPEHLGEELYDHFRSAAAYKLYPDVQPFFASMRELKQQCKKSDGPAVFVGVISNSDPRVKSVLESLGLKVGIDVMPRKEFFIERMSRARVQTMSGAGALWAESQETSDDALKSIWHHAHNARNDVDFLTTSYIAGEEKPHARIFNYAASLAAVNYASKLEQGREDWGPSLEVVQFKYKIASQIDAIYNAKFIHIGDDYGKDYVGSSENGFEAIHLVREGETEAVEGANTVTNLEEAAAAIRIIAEQQFSEV